MRTCNNQCEGVTKQGRQCKNCVVYKGRFCYLHSKTTHRRQPEEQQKSDGTFSLIYRFSQQFVFVVNLKNHKLESIILANGTLLNPSKLMDLYHGEIQKGIVSFDQIVTIGTREDVRLLHQWQKYQLKEIPFHLLTNTPAPPTFVDNKYSVVYKLIDKDDDLDIPYYIVVNVRDDFVEDIFDDLGKKLLFDEVLKFEKVYTFQRPSSAEIKSLKSYIHYSVKDIPLDVLRNEVSTVDDILDNLDIE